MNSIANHVSIIRGWLTENLDDPCVVQIARVLDEHVEIPNEVIYNCLWDETPDDGLANLWKCGYGI